MGNSERVAQIYQMLMQQSDLADGHYKRAILKLADLASKKKQWDDAAGYYEDYLNNFPDDKGHTNIMYRLGRTYEQMGKLEQAAQIYYMFIQQSNSADPRFKTTQATIEKLEGLKK
jgi:TolA-binding protein